MKMKQTATILACALCAVLLLTGCEKKRDALAVGIDTEFPPYSYAGEDGAYIGFDVEMAAALCELEGWELRLVPISWDEKDVLLRDGTIDCVWSGFTINGREDKYTLSIPYSDNSYVIVVRDSSGIYTFEDLEGKIVGVQAASSGAGYLLEDARGKSISKGFKLLSQFTDFAIPFDALEKGSLDAIAADLQTAEYFVKRYGTFRILETTLVEEQYGVAMRKGDTELCAVIDAGLLELAADGTVERLAEKYGIEESICLGKG